MTRYWRRFKRFFRYGLVGWRMHCSCCYDELLDLIIARLKEMESAPAIVEGRAKDVAQMRKVRLMLEYSKNMQARSAPGPSGYRIGVFTLPLDHYDYETTPSGELKWKYPHKDRIPQVVMQRSWFGTQEQEAVRMALVLMSKNVVRWWQ